MATTGSSRLFENDLQASVPEIRIGLSRVGVTGVHKAIRLRRGPYEKLVSARIDCFVDLEPAQKGVDMSRLPAPVRAAERLGDAGFEEHDVERILDVVPLATHNQRGRGTLYVGTAQSGINAERLVEVVESSMSSPVYELLKRPDELHVVEQAHLHA